MSAPPDSLELKRRLSPLVLGIEGVSGLGLPGGRLTIYLETDDADVRRRVLDIVAKAAPTATPHFEVSGPFRKQ